MAEKKLAAAPDAAQMFVDKKTSQPITEDARDDSNRLKSSGMNRDRTDKNAIADEHDFSALRGNLGTKKVTPVVDEEKLEASKAAKGIVPGVAKTANIANQMVVDKKGPTAVTEDARDDSNRLKSSGMNRDRTDKNAIADDFDFASLRAGLGNKKKAPPGGSSGSGSPAAGPSSRQPSVAGVSVKGNSPAQQPQPSPAAEPTIVPPTPQSVPKAVSRQGSTSSMKAPNSPAGVPKSPAASATGAGSGSRAATPVQQTNTPPLSRKGSTSSHQAASPQQELRVPTPTKAPSAAGSEPALSRKGSAASRHSDGPAPAASAHSISRHGSVASRQSHHSAQPQAAPATPYSPASTLPPRPQQTTPSVVQDDEDWKSKAEYLKKQLAETEKQLSKKQQLVKAEKAEVDRQKTKVRDLERQLDEARQSAGGGGGGDDALRDQAARDRRTIEELENKLRQAEKAHNSATSAHRNSIASSRGATYGISQEVVDRLQKDNVTLKAGSEQKDQLIKQLSVQLEAAHEAILSSAAKGFEYDIKLHQARATLVTMLRGSPRRSGSGSPAGTAPPTQHGSPQRMDYSSPQRTSPYNTHGYSSPVIKTPGSPQGRSLY